MGFKSTVLAATTLVLSTSVHAAIVSTHWQAEGDDLITTDTDTGLEWLDLTETNNMSYNAVVSQLGAGGVFEGFRYATSAEVVDLWSKWSVDLAAGMATYTPISDPQLNVATTFLGNTMCEYACVTYPFGVLGLTSESPITDYHAQLGGYYTSSSASGVGTYYYIDGYRAYSDSSAGIHTGSYLVRSTVVPVPAAAWLFASGLIGFIGMARRKKQV